jgi:hypothetical protein
MKTTAGGIPYFNLRKQILINGPGKEGQQKRSEQEYNGSMLNNILF